MPIIPKSSPGKKILMAVTGQVMILFIVFHVLGNLTIYFDQINAYAEKLHAIPPLLWLYRIGAIMLFSVHVIIGINLYLENRLSRPVSYHVGKQLSTTFAGRTMIWSGLIILGFLIYHLLHFTVQIIDTENAARFNFDDLGRPDVLKMVVFGFQHPVISGIYVISMVAVMLHLVHGIQSSFQSLGLNNESAQPVLKRAGSVLAILLFIAYSSIPLLLLTGMVKLLEQR